MRDPRTHVRLLHDERPDMEGPFGRAWNRLTYALEPGDPNDWMATVAAWVIASPQFHPFWDAWNLYGLSLKDIPGVRPAHKHYSDAEWEIGILSVEPETSIDLSNPKGSIKFLDPADLCKQFHGVTGQHVKDMAARMVELIVKHGWSPDSDNRGTWEVLIDRTVEHTRAGCPREGGAR